MFDAFLRYKNYLSVKKPSLRVFFILITFFWGGCSSHGHRAPVDYASQPASLKLNHHVVSRGDTLYGIAWRYNLDYKNLAKINGIRAPYQIHPGQRVKLKGVAPKKNHQAKASSKMAKSAPKPSKTTAKKAPVKPEAAKKSAQKRSKNKSIKPVAAKTSSVKSGSLVWSWPVRGNVVGLFKSGKGLNKGIDIAAKLGESVRAAADGEVVYSGSGLRGYGKLLIIKHKNSYLSAYAHNRVLLAKEGQKVNKGQKIAEVGGSGTTAVKLHFEIRRDGVPIDPLKVLPRQ